MQPKTWNEYVDKLRAPEEAAATATTGSDGSSTDTPPPVKHERPTYISPYATNFINPDHIHPVEQPGQPATNDAPATTNSPAPTASPTTQ
jgi:hypothetical protein